MASEVSYTAVNYVLSRLLGNANFTDHSFLCTGYTGPAISPGTTIPSEQRASTDRYALNGPDFSPAAGGVARCSNVPFNLLLSDRIVAGGTLTHLIIGTNYLENSGTYATWQVTASLAGGGGGAILDNLVLTAGVSPRVLQFSIKVPKFSGGLRVNTLLANWLCDQLAGRSAASALNLLGTVGDKVEVYSGSPPEDADAPPTGVLLASYTVSVAAARFLTPSLGAASLAAEVPLTVVAAGTIGYCRFVAIRSGLSYCIQGTAGESGSDFLFSRSTVALEDSLRLIQATFSI